MKKQHFLIISLIFTFNLLFSAVPDTLPLNINWSFRQQGERWYPAKVPGTVHTDLLNNALIPDPFFGDHEKQLQWIEEKSWEYRCDFDCPRNIRDKKNIILIFKGLDTYTSVYMNNKLILETDNMFREYEINIKPHLKATGNQLLILFHPAAQKGKELAKKLPFTLPGDEKVFSRKAQYHYGWDWGPRFVTAGVWRTAMIRAWDDAVLDAPVIRQISQSADNAHFMTIVTLNVTTAGRYKLQVSGSAEDDFAKSIEIDLPEGSSTHRLDFNIPQPRLWWCTGLGEPTLYTVYISLLKDDRLTDRFRQRIGIRTLELVQEKDEKGESFYFKLNGIKVFMKGANVIPNDNFLPRVRYAKYDSLTSLATSVNMNMLRVWGGGVYEDDAFYDLCDAKGLLVWQDFMFACAMYPGDTAFLNNVEAEVRDNVERLRNHPSLAIWCGNNEIDEGWHNWGWQKQYAYSVADSTTVWGYYQELFNKRIPAILADSDPTRPYHPSSPRIGWGRKESLVQADAHYWGVWWGMEPFETYEKKIGRFMSEYGFQGFPDPMTIQSFTTPPDRILDSPVMKVHQKHPTGFETIRTYMDREFKIPDDIDHYNYVSQLLQAYGITKAIDAHRRAKPWCMGTLYWQLNDCWPVVSWSSTDYFLRKKALHYFLQRSFAPVMVSVISKENTLSVYIISDKPDRISGTLVLNLVDFSGKSYFKKEIPGISLENESMNVFEMPVDQILSGQLPGNVVLHAAFKQSETAVAGHTWYFTTPKNLNLPKPDYTISWQNQKERAFLEIKARNLLKNVYLHVPDQDIPFSENFFDLLPGQSKRIDLPKDINLNQLKRTLLINTLNEL